MCHNGQRVTHISCRWTSRLHYSSHILHIQSYMPVYKLCPPTSYSVIYACIQTLPTYFIFSHICLYTNSGRFDVLKTGFFCTSPLCQIASMATRDTQTIIIKYLVSSVEVTADARKLIETGDYNIRDHFEVATRRACLAPVPVRCSH
jgi:hypothetical protein